MSESATLPGNFLQTFWDLASDEEAERIGAALRLVTHLREQQDSQKEEPCYELGYTLDRLVKGMASHRKMARSGYFITLTEVLQFSSATLSHVMSLINKHLEIGKAKSQEERGAYFGRVFVLLALIEAGKVKTEDEVVQVLQGLQACCKKSYLNEFCAVAMCKLIRSCSEELVRTKGVQLLELEGGGGWDSCTPHRLYMLLSLNQVWGKTKWWKKLTKTHWSSFLKEKSFPRMAAVLAESSSSHPRLHSVWSLVLEAVRAKKRLAPFWKTVVDDGLMTSSHDRKYLGFKLLEMLLPSLECVEVSAVFSPNLVQCWMNNVSSGTNYLHAAAKHLLTVLMNYLQTTRPSLTASILLHLQSSTGNRFEQFIGNKAVVAILSEMDLAGISEYLDKLKELFCDPVPVVDSEQRSGGSQLAYSFSVQLWVADQILNLVRNRKLQRVESWLMNAAHFLFAHSFFDLSKPYEVTAQVSGVLTAPLSKVTQNGCTQKFEGLLAELCAFVTSSKREEGRKFSLPGTMEDGGYFASALMRFAVQLVSEGVEMADPFSEEDKEAWEVATSQVNSLSDKENSDLVNRAFLLLFSVLGIKLFSDRNKTRQSIQELKMCHTEMTRSRMKTPKKKTKDQQPLLGWMDVLVDMLLGFLSEGTQLWRCVVDQVFRMVAAHITPSAMELIVKVLEPQAKEELMKGDDEGSGEEESEEEGGEGEEEGEVPVKRPSEIEGQSDGEESLSSEGEEEGAVDPAFREDVKKALGAAAAGSSDEEGDFDDEAMMAVDEALAEAFKLHMSHRSQKKVKKEEELSVVHFKLRVLDLVEVYLKREYSNPLVLDLVVPLYQLIHHLQSKPEYAPFASRVVSIYKTKLCTVKKYPKVGIDGERVHSHLHTLIELMDKATPTSSPLAILGCMFLLKVLRGVNMPPAVSPLTTRSGKKRKCNGDTAKTPVPTGVLNVAMVTEWFAEALQRLVTKKTSNIPVALFNAYIERFPGLAWLLAPHMTDTLDKAANQFRKTQLYDMLYHLLSQSGEEKEAVAHLGPLVARLQAHCVEQLSSCDEVVVKKMKPMLSFLTKLVMVAQGSPELEELLDIESIRSAVEKLMNKEEGGGGQEAGSEYSKVLAALNRSKTAQDSGTSAKKRTKLNSH